MPQNITDTGRRAHSIAETCALTGLGRDTVYTAIRDKKSPAEAGQIWAQ